MFQELIKSFFLIFMAEMGDKTQILALAFATQFRASKVLIGVFLGVLLNHSIAIILGVYLSKLISVNIIQLAAGISFIIFSLWTLKIDEDDDEEESSKKNYGPILTVAIAFFLGELGDKTQLTAITLSVDSQFPIFVLMGTVMGMILTSGVGIFVGSKLGKRVPEFAIKVVASLIFMAFGVQKLYSSIDKNHLTTINILIFTIILLGIYYYLFAGVLQKSKSGKLSSLQKKSHRLYNLNNSIKEVCLGKDVCKTCDGKQCSIGYSKLLLKNEIENEENNFKEFKNFIPKSNKKYDRDKLAESLAHTILYIMTLTENEEEKSVVHEIRNRLENILFKESFNYTGNVEKYLKLIEKKDKKISIKIRKIINNNKI